MVLREKKDKKNATKTEKLITQADRNYIITNTPASNLGYLAPPGQFFMGAKLFIGTP